MEQNLNSENIQFNERDNTHSVTIIAFDPETGMGVVRPETGPEIVVPDNVINQFGKTKFVVGKTVVCKHMGPGTHVYWLGE